MIKMQFLGALTKKRGVGGGKNSQKHLLQHEAFHLSEARGRKEKEKNSERHKLFFPSLSPLSSALREREGKKGLVPEDTRSKSQAQ